MMTTTFEIPSEELRLICRGLSRLKSEYQARLSDPQLIKLDPTKANQYSTKLYQVKAMLNVFGDHL